MALPEHSTHNMDLGTTYGVFLAWMVQELWPEIVPTPKFIPATQFHRTNHTHQSVTAFPYPISILNKPIAQPQHSLAQPLHCLALPPCILAHNTASISQQLLFHCVPLCSMTLVPTTG